MTKPHVQNKIGNREDEEHEHSSRRWDIRCSGWVSISCPVFGTHLGLAESTLVYWYNPIVTLSIRKLFSTSRPLHEYLLGQILVLVLYDWSCQWTSPVVTEVRFVIQTVVQSYIALPTTLQQFSPKQLYRLFYASTHYPFTYTQWFKWFISM